MTMAEYWVDCLAKRDDRLALLVEAKSEEEAMEKAKNWEYIEIDDPSCYELVPAEPKILKVEKIMAEDDSSEAGGDSHAP